MNNKYDWSKISKDYDSGMSYSDLRVKYGISIQALVNAGKRGDINPRRQKNTIRYNWKGCKKNMIVGSL